MADNQTEVPKPAPPPLKPKPTVIEQARTEIAKARTGFHPERPVHYGLAFVKGTMDARILEFHAEGEALFNALVRDPKRLTLALDF